jgi:hypothetical protein
VVWENTPVTVTADEVMTPPDPEEASALRDAQDWLKDVLENGPVSAVEIQRKAKAVGISTITLRRAKQSLKILAKKQAGAAHGGWEWALEDDTHEDEI